MRVLREVFAPSRLSFVGRGRGVGCCRCLRYARLELFEAQQHLLDALNSFRGLPEAKATQFCELELQMLNLPLLRAQIDALAHDELVMLNQQSL